jgi:O-acetyl-ADP-ribose deacetylase (regulator of RNase III)
MRIEVWQGDITRCPGVEAIVNAANEGLHEGGGVCGAIFRAAGRDTLRRACAAVAPCPTGEARSTPSGDLANRGVRRVIHAVGPVWQGGGAGEADLLASAYRHALEAAVADGVRSVAFPLLSAGIYGYPPAEAAEVGVRSVQAFAGPVERVVLVAFDDAARHTWATALAVRDAGPGV